MPRSAGAHALVALEGEGLGDDADGQDAHLAHRAGDDGRRARAGAAAHAGGDEHHVGAGDLLHHAVERVLGAGLADVGHGAGAVALLAELDAPLRPGLRQRLGVGVGDDEFDAFELGGDHVVHRVAAGTADAEHGDSRT
ncbi:MAG: hypothetical protein WDM81_07095 [Rhizomicrobium sp.]